ncbi:MAG: O-antigen ligase family protein [Candidatus Eremiobacteraeota bacterium]|nr:O-antigen ligase family protein [Candidatus Eremiobacteraeota bacterium]
MNAPRLLRPALALVYFVIPLFPAFITLTAVTVPGVSLVPLPLAIVLLCAMGALAIYGVSILLRPPRQRPPTLVPLLLWLGAGILSALLGFNPLGGALFIAIFGLGVVWHLGLLRYYDAPGAARTIYYSYLASGTLSSIAAILMVLTKTPAGQYTIGHGRAIGTFILPGELAGYCIVFLPIAYSVARATTDRALRWLAIAGCAFGALAFIMTFSRAGWMGMAAAVAFYVFARQRLQLRYALAIPVIGLAAVLIVFNAHHNPSENYTRLSIWQAGLEIVQRFPLTGVGPFDFARVYALVRLPDGDVEAFHAHSFMLTVFAEMGIVGLCAVVYAWWRFALTLRDELARATPKHAAIALAVTAGLVGTWVQGVIDTVSVVIFGLWLPTMALALVTAKSGLGEEEA